MRYLPGAVKRNSQGIDVPAGIQNLGKPPQKRNSIHAVAQGIFRADRGCSADIGVRFVEEGSTGYRRDIGYAALLGFVFFLDLF